MASVLRGVSRSFC